MAGHSHSANIARRKGAVDQKRAKIFSKCSRALLSAARQGGSDPDANLKLKFAIEQAKACNVPKENIERILKRASAGKDGEDFEELVYEGYAPGGIALLVACLTDNRARTASDLKHLFDKRGGNMGTPGSVGFLFDKRSIIAIEAGEVGEDALTELALEAGADDMRLEAGVATFLAAATDFFAVKAVIEARGKPLVSAEIGYVPQNTIQVADRDTATSVLGLIEALEDNDDVQRVYANYDIPAEWL